MLHQPQVLGGHVAGNVTSLGNLPNRQFTLEHQLHHPQPHRVRQGPQALGSLLKVALNRSRLQGELLSCMYYIVTYRHVNQ